MKPKILIFIDWFLPGYKAGGPIKSVANIVRTLQGELDFSIITSNTDFGEQVPYVNIEPNVWMSQDKYRIIYLDRQNQKITNLRKLMQEQAYDLIYLNSLFSKNFSLLPLLIHKNSFLKSKVIVAPRGMLGQGALKLKKQKKQLFLYFAKVLGLYKSVIFHASTAMESFEIQTVFGKKATIQVATNIASLATANNLSNFKTPHTTVFFFLSRISPKKNLLGALMMLSKLSLTNKIIFEIIGPVEDQKYWQQCKTVIAQMPPNIEVNYRGAIPNLQLPFMLKHYHFLLLPTFNENYGHVVVEAWSNGCPVILSDQTPWQNLEEAQVGWDIALNNERRFLKVIEHCVLMEEDEFSQLRRQTKVFMTQKVVTQEIIDQNRRLFNIKV